MTSEISRYRVKGKCAICMKPLYDKYNWYCSISCSKYGEKLDDENS